MSEDMNNIKKMTSTMKSRDNAILHNNLNDLTICKKSLKIIKFMHVVFNSYSMLFSPAKKVSSLAVCVLLLTSCSYTMEEAADKFEDRLESFVGKPMQEVIRRCGHPTKYMNRADLPGEESGTYMIYNFKRFNSECEVILKYKKGTLEIIDWDYSGYCLNTSRFKIDDQCFGL